MAELSGEPLGRMEKIARKSGLLLSRDNYDYERAARAVLDDLRKLRLGKVMLDKVEEDNGR